MDMPKLRFKADDGSDFQEWEKISLGEIFTISAGGDLDKSKSTDKQNESFPYPVYSNSLQNNGLFSYASYYKIDGNTFTVTGRGDVGHAIARHEKYVPIVRLLVCKPKFDDNVDFFAEQVNLAKFANESTGVPQLTAPKLKELKVSRPSIAEQHKIADLLLTVDSVIDKQQAEIAAWEQYKKGVAQKLFDQEVRFKADDGSDYPDWQNVNLNELGRLTSGNGFSLKYQGHTDKPIDFYKVSDMNLPQNYKEMVTAQNTVDDDILKLMKIKPITSPSIIFAKVGMAIHAERKRTVNKPFCMDNNMMAFTPKSDVNFNFCYWLTQTLAFAKHAQPGSPPSLTATIIGNLPVSIPSSIEEQLKIAECLDAINDVIALSKAELEKWRELKQGLLQQLFV